jgi:hypothetical protein
VQKAFRERKKQHVNALGRNASGLGKIIEEMSNRSLRPRDDLLISRLVEPQRLKQTTEVFLSLPRRATRALGGENDMSRSGDELDEDLRQGESSSTEIGPKSELGTPLGDSSANIFEDAPMALSGR